jgi:penicillin-binding protein 2
MDPRKSIPSMFHRRLALVACVFLLVLTVLGAKMIRLSVIEGADRRALAESKLDHREFLPTYRGAIIDRVGRTLALDRASDDLAVEYEVLTGTWARSQAYADARKAVGKAKWSSLGPQQREELIAARLPQWRKKIDDLYAGIARIAGISSEELHTRIDGIKADVQSSAAATWERQRQEEQQKYGTSEDEFKARPIAAQTESHVVVPRLAPEQAFEFRRLAQQFPDMIEVKPSRRREYPWLTANVPLNRNSLPREVRRDEMQAITVNGVADHILGVVRDEVWAQDVARRPFFLKNGEIDLKGYRDGDSVGARGIEAAFEDTLRGSRGEVRERLDTGERIRTDPQPGSQVQLTIDVSLQARVQAILSHDFGLTVVHDWQHNALPNGTPLNAAAVVLEVETGEILAMVSTPTIAMGEQMDDAERLFNQPFVNRASEAIYPPGSIIKPLVLSAAVTEGVHRLDDEIECKGFYFPTMPTAARCWIYRERYGMQMHGKLKAAEALARSCNMFFYTLGDRLGVERLRTWLGWFGLGQRLDIGLTARDAAGKITWTGESTGGLPTDGDIARWKKAGDLKFNETIMGIGQGPITWTPLQAANAYATIARGGVIRDATLVMNDPRGARPPRRDDLHLSPVLVQTTIEGLRESVEEHFGTGHHIGYDDGEEVVLNAQGVTVWAKTGTAQAPPLRTQDTNGDGKINGDDAALDIKLDHSWFVGLVGPRHGKPMYAISVIVEYGASGGRTAGPIANQIIRALQTEGYLPGDPNAPANASGKAPREEPEDDGADHHE